MKSAIDSYKEYKSKQNNNDKRSGSAMRTPVLSQHFQTTSTKSLHLELTEAPCQVSKQPREKAILSPTSYGGSDMIMFGSSEKQQPSLQQYLQFNVSEKQVIQEQKSVECDLTKMEIQELKDQHSEQLQLFDTQINQLKESVQSQQSREENLVEAITLLQGENEILKQQKNESVCREEELMKQSEELISVVEEQTEQLKEKDKQIDQLISQIEETNQIEDNQSCFEQRQPVLQSQMSSPRIADIENRQLQEKNCEMIDQIEELKEKLAIEFNKKRKMKSEYDDQIVEINEELEYYKDKYNEMKNLLENCRDQLRQFEELNQMRNEGIEKLENDNKYLKTELQKQQNYLNGLSQNSARLSYKQEHNQTYDSVQTPSRKYNNNSFSLHLQRVQIDRSSDKGSFGRQFEFGLQNTEKKRQSNETMYISGSSGRPPKQQNAMLSPQQKRLGIEDINRMHQRTSITSMNNNHQDSIVCIEENVQAENMGDESFKVNHFKKHQRSSASLPVVYENEPTSNHKNRQGSHSKKLSQFLSPPNVAHQQYLKTEQVSGNTSLDTSTTYINLPKRRDSCKENRIQQAFTPGYLTENKNSSGQRVTYQYETQRPFRVLSTENRQYQFSERNYQKRPFEYQAFTSPIQNQTLYATQDSTDTQPLQKHLKTACFAQQETTIPDYTQTDDSMNLNKSIASDKLSHSIHKSSIKDEIKKLHNNINSLRQKMGNQKPTNKDDSIQYSKLQSTEHSMTINRIDNI